MDTSAYNLIWGFSRTPTHFVLRNASKMPTGPETQLLNNDRTDTLIYTEIPKTNMGSAAPSTENKSRCKKAQPTLQVSKAQEPRLQAQPKPKLQGPIALKLPATQNTVAVVDIVDVVDMEAPGGKTPNNEWIVVALICN